MPIRNYSVGNSDFFLLSEMEIQLLKDEYDKKIVNKYSVPWCFTNHAGHEKEHFFN